MNTMIYNYHEVVAVNLFVFFFSIYPINSVDNVKHLQYLYKYVDMFKIKYSITNVKT